MLSNSATARSFGAWRSLAAGQALKRVAFARKQQAVREAVAIGDAICRQRRRELAAAAFSSWRARAHVSHLVQARFEGRLRCSEQACFQRWLAYHRSKQEQGRQAELARQHYASALQRQAAVGWRAAVAAAAKEWQQKEQRADAFACRAVVVAAWGRWLAWMDLQAARRERLAAMLASLGSSGGGDRALLLRCWQRWHRMLKQRRRAAARAAEFAGRRRVALLQECFDTWAAYARAMRAQEVDPESPFASPRQPAADAELVWDLAKMVAGGSSSGSSTGSSVVSTDEAASSGVGYTSITVAARPGSGRPESGRAEAGQSEASESVGQAQPRRGWRFGLFRSRILRH